MEASPPTLINPEIVWFFSTFKVPFKLSVVPKVPVLLKVRVVPDSISVAPERVIPFAILRDVFAETTKLLNVPDTLTAKPLLALLPTVTLTNPTVRVSSSESKLFALFNTSALVLASVPPPMRVRVFAPRLTAAPE